ncbi:IPT/TIG domain-containing protein [Actinoplanes sp. NPDC020271]|uniref:IPT/TIG domain-containing protein n=1 Tax=Actinoplanes sp. NPDC020271 TaxID=3363896 RepID=UPI00379E4403
MRKSRNAARPRWTRVGLTTGVVGAALLVYPEAAFAASSVTPVVAPAGGTVTINDDGAGSPPFIGSGTDRVELLTTPGTACPGTYTTPTASILAAASTTSSSTSQVVFVLPTAATAGANGQTKKYAACVYASNTAGSSLRKGAANGYPVYVGTAATASPTGGITGGGNQLTITGGVGGPIFTGVTTVGAQFATQTADCPSTYGTPAAGTSATVTKTSDSAASLTVPSGVTSTSAAPTPYFACLYNGNLGTSALISVVPYNVGQLSLSQAIGPYGGGNNIDVTSPNPFLAGVDTPGVEFTQGETCTSTYTTTQSAGSNEPLTSSSIRKVTNNRVAVTAPAFYTGGTWATALAAQPAGATSIPWQLCIYDGATAQSNLIATSPYKTTVVQTLTRITPNAGPALGGSLITVVGTAFPTDPTQISATLGGVPLTDITPLSSTAFTARTPMHAPANSNSLVVTTPAGTATLNGQFAYTSALVVNPRTAPNTRSLDVVVNGVGFQGAAWGLTLNSGAHIFLSRGNYSNAAISGARANPPVADCKNVLVLSDTELVCRLDLTKRLDLTGTATLSAAPKYNVSANVTAGSRVLTAAASTFDASDVGKAVVDPAGLALAAGTVITNVVSGTTAIMSNPASASLASDATITIASPTYRAATITTTGTNSVAAITAPASTFTQADVGAYPVNGNITAGTTLQAVGSDTGATLSANAATAGASAASIIYSQYVPVPEGAYNLQYVSNAALNAVQTDATYVQSQVSSSSTFTVSAY